MRYTAPIFVLNVRTPATENLAKARMETFCCCGCVFGYFCCCCCFCLPHPKNLRKHIGMSILFLCRKGITMPTSLRSLFGVCSASIRAPFGTVRGRSGSVRDPFRVRNPPQPKQNRNSGGFTAPPPNGRYGFLVQTGLPYNWASL